jgi:hypothetical protein
MIAIRGVLSGLLAALCCAAGVGAMTPGQMKIMIMVQGTGQERAQAAEHALARVFLKQGYQVIDAALVTQTLRRRADLLKQSEIEAAKRLGASLGADIVVSGEAKSRVVDKAYTLLEGKKVLVSQANVSLKAVLARTGKVIAAEHGSGRKPFDTTGEIALQMAAESAAARLSQSIEEFLQRDTVDYRLVVLNVDDAQALAFQEGLRTRLPGVRQVDEQRFQQPILELDVSVDKGQDLAFKQRLLSQSSGLGPGTFAVVGREGETIYLRQTGQARPTAPQPTRPPADRPASTLQSSETVSRQGPADVTPSGALPTLPSAGLAKYNPGYRKSWAVLIGINEYQQWPKLQYAVNDARSVEKLLKGLGFDEVIMVLDGEATQQRILRVLGDELYAKTHDDDRVFIFFAGHGQTQDLPNGGKIGYIIPADGDLHNYYSTAISMRQLQDLAERIRAKHMFYAMDACFSGLLLRVRGEALGAPPAELTTAAARQVLTAGSEGELVVESGGHGLFTKAFINGLAGAADANKDGFITASELYQYIAPQILEESRNAQNPIFGRLGHGQGEFVFARR